MKRKTMGVPSVFDDLLQRAKDENMSFTDFCKHQKEIISAFPGKVHLHFYNKYNLLSLVCVFDPSKLSPEMCQRMNEVNNSNSDQKFPVGFLEAAQYLSYPGKQKKFIFILLVCSLGRTTRPAFVIWALACDFSRLVMDENVVYQSGSFRTKLPWHPDVISSSGETGRQDKRVAKEYASAYESSVYAYANENEQQEKCRNVRAAEEQLQAALVTYYGFESRFEVHFAISTKAPYQKKVKVVPIPKKKFKSMFD